MFEVKEKATDGDSQQHRIREYERNEIMYWSAYYRNQETGITGAKILYLESLFGFCMPGVDVLAFNRVIVNGQDPHDLIRDLKHIKLFYAERNVRRFFLQLNWQSDITPFREILKTNGFVYNNDWVRLERPVDLPIPERNTEISVKKIEKRLASRYSNVILQAFSWPEVIRKQLEIPIDSKGYEIYLAELNGTYIAAGALFLREKYASMALAATLPEARGLGAQKVLIEERIKDARVHGCDWLTVETARDLSDKPSPSYRNLIKYGFNVVHYRPNFILEFE